MKIVLNAEAYDVTDGTTVAELIERVAATSRGSAAAVEGEVVPRAEWARFVLREGHVVELVTAKQGG